MARIGPGFADDLAPPDIPVPDQFRIAHKRFRRRQVFRPVLRPQANLRVTKRGDAAFGRYARAGQHGDVPRRAQRFDEME